METVRLQVGGMECENCVRHVREALLAVDGVESVEVDLAQGVAVVSGTAPEAVLVAALESEAYTAKAG
jgi:copper chaperone